MSTLTIKTDIQCIYQTLCSKSFIKYVFHIEKDEINKESDESISFNRVFTNKDLVELENLKLPSFIGDRFDGFFCTIETTHTILKYDETSIILKYSSVIKKPDYLYNMLKNTQIVLYVILNINKNDNSFITMNFNRKLVNNEEDVEEYDNAIINNSSDFITNIYQKDEIKLQENIVNISESLFGKDMFHNVIMSFINTLYNTIFDIIEETYKTRIIKYFTKKNIEIYKKKQK